MSVYGFKQTFRTGRWMSALGCQADIGEARKYPFKTSFMSIRPRRQEVRLKRMVPSLFSMRLRRPSPTR
jgi:hypothetical protein